MECYHSSSPLQELLFQQFSKQVVLNLVELECASQIIHNAESRASEAFPRLNEIRIMLSVIAFKATRPVCRITVIAFHTTKLSTHLSLSSMTIPGSVYKQQASISSLV